MPPSERQVAWLSILFASLIILAAALAGHAAIGIYRWSVVPDSDCNMATIRYYLNVDGSSGSVDIKNSSGTVIKTLDLAGRLGRGTMWSVVWDGSDNTGANAPTGTYTFVIKVHADPVTVPTTIWEITAGNYMGAACDANPANPTYGQIYIGTRADHNIAVYYPDGTRKGTIVTGFGGSSSPWGGIAVGWNGQVYAGDRSQQKIASFDPVSGAKQSLASGGYLQGHQMAITYRTAGGTTRDSAIYYAAGATTGPSAFRRASINDDYTFNPSTLIFNQADPTINAAGVGTRWQQVGDDATFLVWCAGSGQGTEKWISTDGGLTWSKDPNWTTVDLGRQNGIAAHPGGTLLCGLYNQAPQFQWLNAETGAPSTDSLGNWNYTIPTGWGPSATGGNFDAVGNLVLVSGSAMSNPQPYAGVIAFPDADQEEGSYDEVSITAVHVQAAHQPPILQTPSGGPSAFFTPNSLPADGATATAFSGTVVDQDGAGDHLVAASVHCFGTDYPLTVTRVDDTHFAVSAEGITVPLYYRAGQSVCQVTLQDSYGLTNAGISDPPQYGLVSVTGGTLAGTVKLDLDENERGPVTQPMNLRVHDVNVPDGSKDYSFITAADGTFSVSVHEGTFTVSADRNTGDPTTTGYAPGAPVEGVIVTLGNTTEGVEPGVAPITIAQAKALTDYVPMCIRGICSASRYEPSGGTPGFADQFYLRDSSGPGGAYDGIRVDLSAFDGDYPVEGQTVVVEGEITYPMGRVRSVEGVTGKAILNNPPVSCGEPTPCTIPDFNANPSGPDAGWGRLYKVSGVTITAVDTVNNRLTVSDGSNQGIIDVFATTGIPTGADLQAAYPVGMLVDVTGLKDRIGAWLPNTLRPRKVEDIVPSPTTATYTTPIGFVKGGKWNLVSMPADPDPASTNGGDPLVVFSGVNVADASFQFWRNDADGGGYQSYGELFGWTGPITRGTPYWFLEVGVGTDKEIGYTGIIPREPSFVLDIPSHGSAPFWVMLGTPFPGSIQASDLRFRNISKRGDLWLTWQEAFSETDPNLRIVDSNAQGWDASQNRFLSVTPPPWMGESTQFNPWWGYWLLVFDPGELEIRFPNPAP